MIRALHGAVGSPAVWDSLVPLLPPLDPIPLHDFFKTGPLSLNAAASRICASANTADALLGYSMGGRLALHALLQEPEKWSAAVIVSAHPGLETGHQDRIELDLKNAELSSEDWDQFLTSWNSQSVVTGAKIPQAPFHEQKAVAESFRSWSLGNQQDLRRQLDRICCPVLWVTGARDNKFTDLAREIPGINPLIQHKIISESGHRVPWDQPEEFCKLVRELLDF